MCILLNMKSSVNLKDLFRQLSLLGIKAFNDVTPPQDKTAFQNDPYINKHKFIYTYIRLYLLYYPRFDSRFVLLNGSHLKER